MANKALSKRQKLTFRVEPSQKTLKPRNPIPVPATQPRGQTTAENRTGGALPAKTRIEEDETSGKPDER